MRCGCCNQNGCLYSWGAYYPDFTVATEGAPSGSMRNYLQHITALSPDWQLMTRARREQDSHLTYALHLLQNPLVLLLLPAVHLVLTGQQQGDRCGGFQPCGTRPARNQQEWITQEVILLYSQILTSNAFFFQG